jgi:hypothetical protein
MKVKGAGDDDGLCLGSGGKLRDWGWIRNAGCIVVLVSGFGWDGV